MYILPLSVGQLSLSGRITWGCHGVIAQLTQANTSVRQYYFRVLITYIHIYMYYCFLNIKRTQKNNGGLQCCLGHVTTRECFQASPKGFDTILSPHIDISHHGFIQYIYMYVLLLNHIFDLSMLKTRNFHILLCLFTEYDLYSLPSFPFFRSSVFQHCYHSCSSTFWWIWPLLSRYMWSFLDSPLDYVLQALFYLILIYVF